MPAVLERMQIDLAAAMRARDHLRVAVLRRALSLVANAAAVDPDDHPAGAVEVPRRVLGDADVRAVLAAEHADLVDTAALVRRHGAEAEAADLTARAEVIAAYL